MAITNNNTAVIDLPTWELLQTPITATTTGACICTDIRGSNRHIYGLFSATAFYRYDTYGNSWQQLASPPGGTVGAGTSMVFDPSQGSSGYVWALIANGSASPTFQYYNIATNAWTSRSVSGIATALGTDSSMAHTCTTYTSGGTDDYIYMIGNASTTFYRYGIAANAWASTLSAQSSAPGAGCGLHWMTGVNSDRLYRIRGAAQTTIDYYSISGNSWTGLTYYPATETFTTGTCSIQRGLSSDQIFIHKDATARIYNLDIGDATLQMQATEYLVAQSTAVVGQKICFISETNGISFLYLLLNTGATFLRTPLHF